MTFTNGDLHKESPTEEFGPFGGRLRSTMAIPSCCPAKGLVRTIAALDIFYALLLIGFHLLSLMSLRHGEKSPLRRRFYNLTTQIPPPSTEDAPDEVNFSALPPPTPEEHYSNKSRETMEVLIWVWFFALSILQILVASALYGGTKQRDGRICIRNCGIWASTSTFFILHNLVQITWILIQIKVHKHIFRIFVYSAEIVVRLVGLLAIHRLKKEIRNELCDLEVIEEGSVYYELQPTTPSPLHKQLHRSTPRPSRRHYKRTPVWDLDIDQV